MDPQIQQPYIHRFFRAIRAHFLSGIAVIVPLILTILILVWAFTTVDNIIQPLLVYIFGHRIPGVGFGIVIVAIYLAGVITSNFFGKKVVSYIEDYIVSKIPVVRPLYMGIKEISESFSAPEKMAFLEVVLVEFPRKGIRSIGFITNKRLNDSGETDYYVFVPNAPNPVSGFVLILKKEDLIPTNLSVENAIKIVVSAGKFAPRETNDNKNSNKNKLRDKI